MRPSFRLQNPMYVPALILMVVSGWTVVQGAFVVRGQQPAFAGLLAAGLLGAAFLIEKEIMESLASVRPKKNLLRLVVCFLPFFAACVALSAVVFFQVHHEQIAADNQKATGAQRWQREKSKIDDFLATVRIQLQDAQTRDQRVLRDEVQRIAAARAARLPFDTGTRDRLRDELAAFGRCSTLLNAIPALPIDPPNKETDQGDRLTAAFTAVTTLASALPPPIRETIPKVKPEPLTTPVTDVPSMLWEETRKRSPNAVFAWVGGLLTEILPFLCLWAGVPSIPVSRYIMVTRERIVEIWRSLADSLPGGTEEAIAFTVEPYKLGGSFHLLRRGTTYALADLDVALGKLAEVISDRVGHTVRIVSVSNSAGDTLSRDLPLVAQIQNRPLSIRVEEVRA
jgi:hypothetical protein